MSTIRRASSLVVGVDLGGTNMQIGVVNARHRIIGRMRSKTEAHEGAAAVIDRIADGVEIACQQAGLSIQEIAAVGVVAPGAIDIPKGVVLEAPNLRWKNLPLRARLQRKLGCQVIVDNDVNGAVWGESRLGAGRGRGDMLGVWVGTGVGGGLILNGSLYYGEFFTAGEIGQTVLFPGGRKGRITVEDFCSRTGMARTIKSLLRRRRSSSITGDVSSDVAGQLRQAYKQRNPLALKVVHEAADLLGVAIANWITALSLDTVIIGGGVTEAFGRPYLNRIRASFQKHVFPKRCRRCALLMTHLKDDAGLLGAALLASEACER